MSVAGTRSAPGLAEGNDRRRPSAPGSTPVRSSEDSGSLRTPAPGNFVHPDRRQLTRCAYELRRPVNVLGTAPRRWRCRDPHRHGQGPRHPSTSWDDGLSHGEVRRSLGIPFTTVADHVRRAKVAGLTWPLAEDLDDAALEALLFTEVPPTR